jgi:hypothetical protein
MIILLLGSCPGLVGTSPEKKKGSGVLWRFKKAVLKCVFSFLLENKRRNRPKDARTVSVERQRIFHRNRIQHQCLRERASVQEKHQSRILTGNGVRAQCLTIVL